MIPQLCQPAISLVTTLCVALVGLFPASLWADCCCTLPKSEATATACACCVAVPESCCSEHSARACHSDPSSPADCSCEACSCDRLTDAPPAPQPREDGQSRVVPVAAVLASAAWLPVDLEATLIAGAVVLVESAYSRPVRELFCVWVI